eukprot:13697606-Alexandrium_andersonii.AAC.1
MSASLVGSEMCIRDSLRGAGGHGHHPRPGRRGQGGDGGLAEPEKGLGPVSYTHLTLPTICSV